MAHLPVIVGFGGVNSAGRSSFHHGFNRMVIDHLSPEKQQETYLGLATLMGLLRYEQGCFQDREGKECNIEQVADRFGNYIREHTLLRKIERDFFDVDNVEINHRVTIEAEPGVACGFLVSKKSLPRSIPDNWKLNELNDGSENVRVEVQGSMDL